MLRVTEDISFKTPSGAANFVAGASLNLKVGWKVKGTGQPYGDWRQAQLEQAEPQQEQPEVIV